MLVRGICYILLSLSVDNVVDLGKQDCVLRACQNANMLYNIPNIAPSNGRANQTLGPFSQNLKRMFYHVTNLERDLGPNTFSFKYSRVPLNMLKRSYYELFSSDLLQINLITTVWVGCLARWLILKIVILWNNLSLVQVVLYITITHYVQFSNLQTVIFRLFSTI